MLFSFTTLFQHSFHLIYLQVETIKATRTFLQFLEPVGSVAPKVNIADKIRMLSVKHGHVTDLLCPAQSYPMASFRYFHSKTKHFVILRPLI